MTKKIATIKQSKTKNKKNKLLNNSKNKKSRTLSSKKLKVSKVIAPIVEKDLSPLSTDITEKDKTKSVEEFLMQEIQKDLLMSVEEFLSEKCPKCKKKYSLESCKYTGGNPTCPHCGYNYC